MTSRQTRSEWSKMMKARLYGLAGAIQLTLSAPCYSSVDYKYPEYVTHSLHAECNGERVQASFSTWHRGDAPVGLKSVQVGGKRLSPAELRRIEVQFGGKRIVKVSIVGCRLTSKGGNRVWFTAESERPDPTTNALPVNISFYVRNGRLEYHETAPID